MSDNHDYVACPSCNWKGRTDQLSEAQDLLERLDPGDTVPEGQCPECGALVCESNPLIDAAPDLLAALQAMVEPGHQPKHLTKAQWEHLPWIVAARAAISKATGNPQAEDAR